MNAFCSDIYNFVSSLVLGKDSTCTCQCGRDEVSLVVPYTGAQFTVNSHTNWSGGILAQQDADVLFGLCLGFCIFWFLLWLDKARHSGCDFYSWLPKFTSIRSFLGRLYPKTMQDSRGGTTPDGDEYFLARDVFDQ